MPPTSHPTRPTAANTVKGPDVSSTPRTTRLWIAALSILSLMPLAPVSGQVLDDVEDLDWNRPEAWAMKYFNSVSLLTGLGPPRVREPWSISIGLELDVIPRLDEDQRRVGFGGVKVEDLNRLPAFVRPRVTIGLPARWSLDLAWVPPLEVRRVTSNLFALGFERPVFASEPWTLGIRFYGQIGTVKSDFTCSEEDASYPPGSPDNIWGCLAPSEDEVTLNHLGAAFTGGYRVRGTDFHWGLAATYMDMEFQVDALLFELVDRTLLRADGWTWSFNGGASWSLGRRTSLAVELFYSPLGVVRPPSTSTDNDPLLNLRSMLRFEL